MPEWQQVQTTAPRGQQDNHVMPAHFFEPQPGQIPTWRGIRWFFTTRQGGCSQDGYAGLNLGTHVGDDPVAVYRNRASLAEGLRIGADRLRIANQVHGTNTLIITNEDSWPDPPPDGDALVTTQSGMAIIILTADCVPVLLADPQGRVVGAIHAGWRGALHGVLESGVDKMVSLGGERRHIHAILGPCIRAPSYVVGEEVRNRFLALNQQRYGTFFARYSVPVPVPVPVTCSGETVPERFHFDLAGLVKARLNAHGIAQDQIHDLAICTHVQESSFFSHRRSMAAGTTPTPACGRQGSGILLL